MITFGKISLWVHVNTEKTTYKPEQLFYHSIKEMYQNKAIERKYGVWDCHGSDRHLTQIVLDIVDCSYLDNDFVMYRMLAMQIWERNAMMLLVASMICTMATHYLG